MQGLAFHCHHDVLCEWVTDYDERVEFIKSNKPKEEQALRLRLFKMIPKERIPGKNSPQWKAYCKAWDAHCKAWDARDKAGETCDKAWEAYCKAWATYDKARGAYDKARKAYDKAYDKQLETLHKELCPNCPWNGRTIFGGKK